MPEHSRSIPGLCTTTTIDPATDNPAPFIDPELFFSDDPAEIAAAKAICHACPVRVSCRETAHQQRIEFGVWGGESAEERLGRPPLGKAVYKRSPEQQARSSEQAKRRREASREQLLSQPA